MTLLAVYLDYRNDVRQKSKFQWFFIQVQMVCKATETAHNIDNAFGAGVGNECTVQQWFQTFC